MPTDAPRLRRSVLQWTHHAHPRPPLGEYVIARVLEHYGVSRDAGRRVVALVKSLARTLLGCEERS
jgi:hypothetical protein